MNLTEAKALSHPVRCDILSLLEDGDEASPRQLARSLEADIGVVAYHVRVLVGLGYLDWVRDAHVRGAVQHFYRIAPQIEPTKAEAEEWAASPKVRAMLKALMS